MKTRLLKQLLLHKVFLLFAILVLFGIIIPKSTVYAANLPAYKITYKLNGGKHVVYPITYYKSNSSYRLTTPSKTGFTFLGYCEDSGLLSPPIRTIPKYSKGSKILYAKWSANLYPITYELNGGEFDDNLEIPSTYMVTTKTFVPPAPQREGYDFLYWCSNSLLTRRIYSIVQGSTKAKILYAKWRAKTVPINYALNGGTNSPYNPVLYRYGSSNILLDSPSRSGYVFDGWYQNSTFTTSVSELSTTQLEPVTLYAKWKNQTPETNLFLAINAYRETNSLPALEWDETLFDYAYTRCTQITTDFSHNDLNTSYAENYARLSKRNAPEETVFGAWINSESHNNNLLGEYSKSAIASYEKNGVLYFVQLFSND